MTDLTAGCTRTGPHPATRTEMAREYLVYSCCMDPTDSDYGRGAQFEGSFDDYDEAVKQRDAIQHGDRHDGAWIEVENHQ